MLSEILKTAWLLCFLLAAISESRNVPCSLNRTISSRSGTITTLKVSAYYPTSQHCVWTFAQLSNDEVIFFNMSLLGIEAKKSCNESELCESNDCSDHLTFGFESDYEQLFCGKSFKYRCYVVSKSNRQPDKSLVKKHCPKVEKYLFRKKSSYKVLFYSDPHQSNQSGFAINYLMADPKDVSNFFPTFSTMTSNETSTNHDEAKITRNTSTGITREDTTATQANSNPQLSSNIIYIVTGMIGALMILTTVIVICLCLKRQQRSKHRRTISTLPEGESMNPYVTSESLPMANRRVSAMRGTSTFHQHHPDNNNDNSLTLSNGYVTANDVNVLLNPNDTNGQNKEATTSADALQKEDEKLTMVNILYGQTSSNSNSSTNDDEGQTQNGLQFCGDYVTVDSMMAASKKDRSKTADSEPSEIIEIGKRAAKIDTNADKETVVNVLYGGTSEKEEK